MTHVKIIGGGNAGILLGAYMQLRAHDVTVLETAPKVLTQKQTIFRSKNDLGPTLRVNQPFILIRKFRFPQDMDFLRAARNYAEKICLNGSIKRSFDTSNFEGYETRHQICGLESASKSLNVKVNADTDVDDVIRRRLEYETFKPGMPVIVWTAPLYNFPQSYRPTVGLRHRSMFVTVIPADIRLPLPINALAGNLEYPERDRPFETCEYSIYVTDNSPFARIHVLPARRLVMVESAIQECHTLGMMEIAMQVIGNGTKIKPIATEPEKQFVIKKIVPPRGEDVTRLERFFVTMRDTYGIHFVGRYARWDHEFLMEDVITQGDFICAWENMK